MPYDSAPRNCFFQRRQGMTLERLFLLIPHVAEAPEPLWAPRAPRPKESLMFTLSNPAWKSNHPVAAAAGLIHTPSDQAAASPTSHRANEAFSPIPLEVEDAAVGSPIVTVSFGASRNFRLTRGKPPARQVRNFEATAGTVFVMPWDTNKEWKHEVPHRKCDTSRRVSVTFRAFSPERKSKV